jgi:alkanesulfonate monooxygenase SsuD/methylene tetrahydromethanopterin reductase-like flavin-dependent oxidoreductase (luciferase family)
MAAVARGHERGEAVRVAEQLVPLLALIAVPHGRGREWTASAASWEDAGWDTLLVPDNMRVASPFPALASAAAVTTRLRVRPWVLAAPLRSTAATVREVQELQDLSDGRFDLGLGTGRPDAAGEAAALGMPWPDGAGRRRAVEDVVHAVRDRVRPAPPVAITASGPAMIRTAVGLLTGPDDRLGLAAPPTADADALQALVGTVRSEGLPGDLHLTYQLSGIGSRVPMFLARMTGLDAAALRSAGAVGLLPEDPDEAADELRRWPERFGVDEVVVSEDLLDGFAPVLARLR